RTDIDAVIYGLVKGGTPSEANHALGVLKTLFAWCTDGEMLEVDPCVKVKKPAKQGKRKRKLNEEELRKLWRALPGEGFPFGHLVKLLILTAQRRGEVSQMEWQQLDFERRLWTIPEEIAKNGVEHVVPLSDLAIEVLQSVPGLNDTYVFP